MGMLIPQIPTPLMIRYPTARLSTITKVNAKPNPASHPRETGRVSTIAAILSVTVA
jgi:hypothetical protein